MFILILQSTWKTSYFRPHCSKTCALVFYAWNIIPPQNVNNEEIWQFMIVMLTDIVDKRLLCEWIKGEQTRET